LYNFIDSVVALNAAFFVNASILILAATTFYYTGHQGVAKIEDAHSLLAPLLGSSLAPILFAIALIAAGQSSTVTGTLAGQIVMEGYLKLRLNPWLRRLLTRFIAITPAVLVIGIMGEDRVDALLVLSQVILSLQLGFAVIPLIHFVSDKKTMGEFAIGWKIKVLAWLVAAILVYLNGHLVFDFISEIMHQANAWGLKIFLILLAFGFLILLGYVICYPLFLKRQFEKQDDFHGLPIEIDWSQDKPINKVAIAVDFSATDAVLIKKAIQQVHQLSASHPPHESIQFILIHVVESATAKYLHEASDDQETRKDQERLNIYSKALSSKGYQVTSCLGYGNRVKEIVRCVQLYDAQLLVMGGHRHQGWKDYIFGETIESVRHKVSIPVLIVNHGR
jgi:manganese transport protein